jgi:general secretion pathway protein G
VIPEVLLRARPICRPASRRRRQAGFTLLELLVVLLILGLIASFVAPQVFRYLGRARADAARIQIEQIGQALDLFRLDTGRYPTGQEGLEGLFDAPATATGWNGPYVNRADQLVDPWGEPYRYRAPGQHGEYDLYSLGADGVEGGEGEDADVTSW